MKIKFSTFALIFSFLFVSLNAQNTLYTVQGIYNNVPVGLDSILFENLDTETRLLIAPLPVQDDYRINLSKGVNEGATSIKVPVLDDLISLSYNVPGYLGIRILSENSDELSVQVYNLQGQLIRKYSRISAGAGDVLDVHLPGNNMYMVNIQSGFGSKSFRAIGSTEHPEVNLETNAGLHKSREVNEKSAFSIADTFVFRMGDELRISAYKAGYYTRPKLFEIASSEFVTFHFEVSQVETYGVSDVYVSMDSITTITPEFSPESGEVIFVNQTDSLSVSPGDIVTVDLDTAGYLRKVISVEEGNGETILQTEQAFMEDVFINKAFKLNTSLIEPQGSLKGTGTIHDIAKSLTDEQGFIHPYKAIWTNKHGELMEINAFNMMKATKDTVSLIESFKDLSDISLYGNKESPVRFYFKNGMISFNADAVLEFDFGVGGTISEKTKIRKGKLKYVDFYVVANAHLLANLALEIEGEVSFTNKDDKGKIDPILNLASPKLVFVVPPAVIWVDFDVDLIGMYEFGANASLNTEFGFSADCYGKIGAHFDREAKSISPIKDFHSDKDVFPLELNGEINAKARLELYPRVQFKLYSIVGPYVEVVPYIEGSYNSAFSYSQEERFLAWRSGLDMGLDLRAGLSLGASIDLKIFELGLKKEYNLDPISIFHTNLWSSPNKLERLSELPESVSPGEEVTILYKVTDSRNSPVRLATVTLSGDGFFDRNLIVTNASGEASTSFYPEEVAGDKEIRATIYNPNNEVIAQEISNVNMELEVKASFSASSQSIYEGETIRFTDQSSGDPSSWNWDFGDGGSSAERNPSHTFATAGTFSVSLTVTNDNGSDTEIKEDYIKVSIDPGSGGEALANTDIDFSNNQYPENWQFEVPKEPAGITNEEMQARVTDGRCILGLDCHIPASMNALIVEWDANQNYASWGMDSRLLLHFGDYYVDINGIRKDREWGNRQKLRIQKVAGDEMLELSSNLTEQECKGTYHYKAVVKNDGITFSTYKNGALVLQTECSSAEIDQSFEMHNLSRIDFQLRTTTNNDNFLDNIKIRLE